MTARTRAECGDTKDRGQPPGGRQAGRPIAAGHTTQANPTSRPQVAAQAARVGSGARAIEVLEQVVGGQFNLFVIEL